MKPYIQPFEKRLALLELQALAGDGGDRNEGEPDGRFVQLHTNADPSELAAKLAYWQEVYVDALTVLPTKQALLESAYESARSGRPVGSVKGENNRLANRRVLRYASHGLHEYRGKFFPQLVGALLNIAGASAHSIVVDPMCGSGTTLVEATIRGLRSIGIDLNPLSVLISRAKCGALQLSVRLLRESQQEFSDWLSSKQARGDGCLDWLVTLPEVSQDYLRRWFPAKSLLALDTSVRRILEIPNPRLRDFYLVCLSNVLRGVSYQRESDLRVRRDDSKEVPAVARVLSDEIERATNALCAHVGGFGKAAGKARVVLGDARNASDFLGNLGENADICITSPPYATALPYLDTDRLSLYYLNLFSRKEHRRADLEMIGNREITNGHRSEYLKEYLGLAGSMPVAVTELITKIDRAYKEPHAGFRRKNLSALLAKYFIDMKSVFASTASLLKPRAHAFIVVGNNHTDFGSEVVEIRTPELLASLAELNGFELQQIIPMELLVSRDIFRKNGGTRECLLVMRRSA